MFAYAALMTWFRVARAGHLGKVLAIWAAVLLGIAGKADAGSGQCPGPCDQAKANLQAMRNVLEQDRAFLDQFEKSLGEALRGLNYKKVKRAYLGKMEDDLRTFMQSAEYKRLSASDRIRQQKSYSLKARQDLMAIRGILRNLRSAKSRVRWHKKSLDNLEKNVLKEAEKLVAKCKGDGAKARRTAARIQELLQKARRWLCWKRRDLLRGYSFAKMKAGFSPLGFGTVEQIEISHHSRTLHGAVNQSLQVFATPKNISFWDDAGIGYEMREAGKALETLQKVLTSHFGYTAPEKCKIPKIQPITTKKKGKKCVKAPKPIVQDEPPGKEIVVRKPGECVGEVVERWVPEKLPRIVEKPTRPKPEEKPAPLGIERPRAPQEKPTEKKTPEYPPAEETEAPVPEEEVVRLFEPLEKDEWEVDLEKVLEDPDEDPEQRKPSELGLVKAKKEVVELILRRGDTGKPVSEGVVKIADAAPPLPSENAGVPIDAVMEAVSEMFDIDPYESAPPWLEDVGDWLLDTWLRTDVVRAEDFERLEDKLKKSPEISEQKAREIVQAIKEYANELGRSPYHEDAQGGKADKQGRVRVSVPAGTVSKKTKKITHHPRRQKVVLLPGNASKEAVQRLAKAGKVKELPVMKHPRTGKPVKPVVVNIPDTPEAEKKLREAARKAGGRDAAIYDDPCLDKEEQAADFVPDDPLYASKGAWGQDFPNQWAIRRIGFTTDTRSAWAVRPLTGKTRKVVVAIIDSGLDWQHPDFDVRSLWRNPGEIPDNGEDDDGNGYVDDIIGWDFINDNNRPWDQDGHGTFVAGVIGAATNNGYGIAGINPDAKLMILRALGPFGRGYGSAVAQAVLYAVDNGADIINLSLGTGTYTPLLHMAIERAREKGVIVVVAAGNQAKHTKGRFPAGLPGVITVTATDRNDRRAPFSNWGTHVDIAAPGVDVLSLRARGTDLLAFIPDVKYEPGKGVVGADRTFYRASGTSFAAPMVSGALSLILSRRPEVTRKQAVRMLLNSARDIETPGIDNYTGYGLLDVAAALRADPQFFAEARITGVKVVHGKKGAVVHVLGTARANRLKDARLYIGKGKSPVRWRAVGRPFRKSVQRGVVGRIPAHLLAGAARWTLRLVVTHANGLRREARYVLRVR